MENKNFSWNELKDFCNNLSDSQLNNILIVDYGESTLKCGFGITSVDLYICKHDIDEVYEEDEYNDKISNEEIFEIDFIHQPKGVPFLTTEI